MIVTWIILTLTCLVFLTESAMEPFVIGGMDAKIFDFPYVAYLGVECVAKKSAKLESWICGSSVLNQNVLMTAGHCLFGCSKHSLIVIYVGHENIMEGVIATAHSFLIHEHYSHTWLANDIALVKLRKPLTLSKSIIRVAVMRDPPYKEEAKLAGWGVINEKPIQSTHMLQFIKQHVWETQDCLDVLKRLPAGTFCAGDQNGSGYASAGDSGSPLVVRGFIQIGIVSSKSATRSSSLTVYTDVGYFANWIEANVNKIVCHKG